MAACLDGDKDEHDQEKLLSEAIALSEEDENDEEALLRQAIDLSLECWK